MEREITLYAAIHEMRRLTAIGQTFSFSFVSYNRLRRHSDGIRTVYKARLRKAAKAEKVDFANHKLFFEDLEQPTADKNRNCWQILILVFNGMKIKAE